MRMKKRITLLLTVLSLFFLASCSDKDEVAEALIVYNNDKWVPINQSKNDKMDELKNELSKLENEEKNQEAAIILEQEIIPLIDEVQQEFKDVELNHKRVKKLNTLEVEAEEVLKKQMKDVAAHYKGKNITEQDIHKGNEKIKEKFQEVIDYRFKLIDEFDLEYVEDDESLGNLRNLKHKEK